ncbi:MAG: polyphenol oxidase family protein, partial [Desulfonatronovibrio sp.]
HGDAVHFDLKGDFLEGSRYEGDGICASEAKVALMIKTADCQPVFMTHESGRYICALHIGWRGNRINFPGTGLRLFCDHYGIDPHEVFALRGPSLGPCCAEFTDFHEHWGQGFEDYYSSKSKTMDLWSLSRDQLIDGGIRRENIFSMDVCTKCNDDLFFSYRREKISGRQGNFLMID